MKFAIRTLGELGPDLVLAPERHVLAARAGEASGITLGELVVERRERIDVEHRKAVVLDTTHARDGVLDVAGALRDVAGTRSAKKGVREGDVVISRLRPYLRQLALVHRGALAIAGRRPLALSTEFYVLSPRTEDDDLAYLVPWLLADDVQAALAAAQEGGHHPRVPRTSLMALRVPHEVVRRRAKTSRAVRAALDHLYRGASALRALVS
jgi:hypothetical protein